jgi:hypothetical protein
LLGKGTHVPVLQSFLKLADAIFYHSGGHMTLYAGIVNGVPSVLSHGKPGQVQLLPLNYWPPIYQARRYLAE